MDLNDNSSSVAYLLEASDDQPHSYLRVIERHLLKTTAKYLNLDSQVISLQANNDQLLSPE
jgi:hypothetical protein